MLTIQHIHTGIEVESQAGSLPHLLLTAPHARVHAAIGPPLVGKGVHYLRLRPYLTEKGGGAIERGAALEGEGPGQGHVKLVMRSVEHPSQRQARATSVFVYVVTSQVAPCLPTSFTCRT